MRIIRVLVFLLDQFCLWRRISKIRNIRVGIVHATQVIVQVVIVAEICTNENYGDGNLGTKDYPNK